MMSKHPIAVRWLKANAPDLTSMKGLEGHAVGIPLGTEIQALWPAIVQFFGLDATKIRVENPSSTVTHSAQIKGVFDYMIEYDSGAATLEVTAKQAGMADARVGYAYLADWGFDLYGNGIVTTEKMIQERPDLVRRFVTAVARSTVWTLNNPDEAYQIFLKYNPETKGEDAAKWKTFPAVTIVSGTEQHGIGYYIPEKAAYTAKTVAAAYNITMPGPPEDVYTNAFIEQVPKEYRYYKTAASSIIPFEDVLVMGSIPIRRDSVTA
jgi:NitT/TauT family transport system substrate-binding protein